MKHLSNSCTALALVALSLGLSARAVRAQSGEYVPDIEQRYAIDTGFVHAPDDGPSIAVAFPVSVAGATSLRLFFREIVLPEGALLRITSPLDGAVHQLERRHVREWGLSSAYLNGDTVWVEVLTEPGMGDTRLVLDRVAVGAPAMASLTQCGSGDERVLSGDLRVARVVPGQCTSWIIVDGCNHCLLTAGHCIGVLQVIEFQVPASTSSGAIQHPAPEHQYIVDASSIQSTSGGMGNDWGYFGCFANSQTGLTPFERQAAAFTLHAPPTPGPSVTVRVTGCGYDDTPWTANYVPQTGTGSFPSASGHMIQHTVDTRGGSSGSPIVRESTGNAIGIHTHGGCTTTGGTNAGTSVALPNILTAIGAPRGVCNCSGTWSTYCSAKVNSQGCTPAIAALGTPTASGGAGSFTIRAVNVINNQNGTFLYGLTPDDVPFQGGHLCVAGQIVRTAVQNSGGTPPPANCSGTLSIDMGARIAAGVDARLHAGATIVGQFYYRDPASPSYPTGLTNAIRFTIGP